VRDEGDEPRNGLKSARNGLETGLKRAGLAPKSACATENRPSRQQRRCVRWVFQQPAKAPDATPNRRSIEIELNFFGRKYSVEFITSS
jgi:hypothetical protein